MHRFLTHSEKKENFNSRLLCPQKLSSTTAIQREKGTTTHLKIHGSSRRASLVCNIITQQYNVYHFYKARNLHQAVQAQGHHLL